MTFSEALSLEHNSFYKQFRTAITELCIYTVTSHGLLNTSQKPYLKFLGLFFNCEMFKYKFGSVSFLF